jgi:glycine/D-amino acid oxidase-like deaminating enzyme
MNRTADAVVIGSGAIGASAAFQLARLGRRTILVEKFDLASQTSARAAGLSQKVQVDDLLMDLAIRGIQALTHFEDYAGEPLDVVINGSVKLARREPDVAQLEEEVRRGQAAGVEISTVSAAEARRLAPWFNSDKALALAYSAGDTYIENPRDLPLAFIRAFRKAGGEAIEHCAVTDVLLDGARVKGVVTAQGNIEAPIVVDAAGAWSRTIGDRINYVIPLWPVRHQLCITEPLDSVSPTHPTARVMDAKVYVRPCRGGLMFGAYEGNPLVADPREKPSSFEIKDLPFEAEPLKRLMLEVRDELPIFGEAELVEVRGGLPTMTPDGHFIIDTVPGIQGFYVASGCNVGGFSISPPIGEDLAAWIVRGGPRPANLEPYRIDRFADSYKTEAELRDACVATYTHKYDEEEVVRK